MLKRIVNGEYLISNPDRIVSALDYASHVLSVLNGRSSSSPSNTDYILTPEPMSDGRNSYVITTTVIDDLGRKHPSPVFACNDGLYSNREVLRVTCYDEELLKLRGASSVQQFLESTHKRILSA